MILIFRCRLTGEIVKRYINPSNKEEYYQQIKEVSKELIEFELLDISNFWSHITK